MSQFENATRTPVLAAEEKAVHGFLAKRPISAVGSVEWPAAEKRARYEEPLMESGGEEGELTDVPAPAPIQHAAPEPSQPLPVLDTTKTRTIRVVSTVQAVMETVTESASFALVSVVNLSKSALFHVPDGYTVLKRDEKSLRILEMTNPSKKVLKGTMAIGVNAFLSRRPLLSEGVLLVENNEASMALFFPTAFKQEEYGRDEVIFSSPLVAQAAPKSAKTREVATNLAVKVLKSCWPEDLTDCVTIMRECFHVVTGRDRVQAEKVMETILSAAIPPTEIATVLATCGEVLGRYRKLLSYIIRQILSGLPPDEFGAAISKMSLHTLLDLAMDPKMVDVPVIASTANAFSLDKEGTKPLKSRAFSSLTSTQTFLSSEKGRSHKLLRSLATNPESLVFPVTSIASLHQITAGGNKRKVVYRPIQRGLGLGTVGHLPRLLNAIRACFESESHDATGTVLEGPEPASGDERREEEADGTGLDF